MVAAAPAEFPAAKLQLPLPRPAENFGPIPSPNPHIILPAAHVGHLNISVRNQAE